MIIKRPADNITTASYEVAMELLEMVPPERPVILKPNLVEPSPPPVTTDVRVVAGVISALREFGIHDITVAEGSGTGDTLHNFTKLGFTDLGVKLVDLDKEKTVTLPVHNFRVWREIVLPEMLLNTFIISIPVLKEHSLCGVTISLKNMVGMLPAKYYSGYWSYKKSLIHKYDTDGCIADLLSLIQPNLAIVDASLGMKGHHLSGTVIEPPLNLIYGSDNILDADLLGCELLGKRWEHINYIRMIKEDTKRG